ncbi:MAG: hypothetical protein RSC43_07455 [Clostridia bacterium]
MTVQTIARDCIVVSLNESDMQICGRNLCECDVIQIVRRAFLAQGIRPGGKLRIDAYINGDNLMIIANLAKARVMRGSLRTARHTGV